MRKKQDTKFAIKDELLVLQVQQQKNRFGEVSKRSIK